MPVQSSAPAVELARPATGRGSTGREASSVTPIVMEAAAPTRASATGRHRLEGVERPSSALHGIGRSLL